MGRFGDKEFGAVFVDQAEDVPIGAGDMAELTEPTVEEGGIAVTGVQFFGEAEDGGEAFVGGGELLGHGVEGGFEEGVVDGGLGILLGFPDRGALAADDEAIFVFAAPVADRIGEDTDEEQSAATFVEGVFGEGGLIREVEAIGMIDDAEFDGGGIDFDDELQGEFDGGGVDVFDGVIAAFGADQFPAVDFENGQALTFEETADGTGDFANGGEVAGAGEAKDASGRMGDSGHGATEGGGAGQD
jgi:hypothetical protein